MPFGPQNPQICRCEKSVVSIIDGFAICRTACSFQLLLFLDVLFHLFLIKSLSVHAIDMRLRNKRMWVDCFYYPEDGHGLDFAAHHKKHLNVVFSIPSCAVD